MAIHGFNKLTLLDYPGKVAAVIFLGSCNFRCPFCQNSELVLDPASQPVISEEEIIKYLEKRKGILDGVCITGGEPALCEDLPMLCGKIKALGYAVKLDTNGSRPDVVRSLAEKGLIDMVAMDIKSSKENYAKTAGLAALSLEPIEETADFLLRGSLPYEFRTTAVRELHTEEDFISIGKWIAGADAYFLQAYRDSPQVMERRFHSFSLSELESFRQILRNFVRNTEIRGI